MKARILLIGLCFLISHQLYSQENLIKNGSFEVLKNRFPTGWHGLGSPDCYRDSSLIKDRTKKKFQFPYEGRNYIGIGAYQIGTEVLFCKLSEPLKKGQIYSISMYVFCPKERPSVSVPEISIYISKEVMRMNGRFWCSSTVNYTVLKNDKYEILKDDFEWIEVTGEFTAQGGEQFFSIGNFVGVNTDFVGNRIPESTRASRDLPDIYYYFYDAVSLVEKDNIERVADFQVNEPIVIEHIYFEFGKDELLPSSFKSLDALVKKLKKEEDMLIEISGHTDNIGDIRDNQKLSEQRAKSVYTYFIKKGIKADKMKFIGFGESQPIANNNSEEGRKENRRVEFKLIPIDY